MYSYLDNLQDSPGGQTATPSASSALLAGIYSGYKNSFIDAAVTKAKEITALHLRDDQLSPEQIKKQYDLDIDRPVSESFLRGVLVSKEQQDSAVKFMDDYVESEGSKALPVIGSFLGFAPDVLPFVLLGMPASAGVAGAISRIGVSLGANISRGQAFTMATGVVEGLLSGGFQKLQLEEDILTDTKGSFSPLEMGLLGGALGSLGSLFYRQGQIKLAERVWDSYTDRITNPRGVIRIGLKKERWGFTELSRDKLASEMDIFARKSLGKTQKGTFKPGNIRYKGANYYKEYFIRKVRKADVGYESLSYDEKIQFSNFVRDFMEEVLSFRGAMGGLEGVGDMFKERLKKFRGTKGVLTPVEVERANLKRAKVNEGSLQDILNLHKLNTRGGVAGVNKFGGILAGGGVAAAGAVALEKGFEGENLKEIEMTFKAETKNFLLYFDEMPHNPALYDKFSFLKDKKTEIESVSSDIDASTVDTIGDMGFEIDFSSFGDSHKNYNNFLYALNLGDFEEALTDVQVDAIKNFGVAIDRLDMNNPTSSSMEEILGYVKELYGKEYILDTPTGVKEFLLDMEYLKTLRSDGVGWGMSHNKVLREAEQRIHSFQGTEIEGYPFLELENKLKELKAKGEDVAGMGVRETVEKVGTSIYKLVKEFSGERVYQKEGVKSYLEGSLTLEPAFKPLIEKVNNLVKRLDEESFEKVFEEIKEIFGGEDNELQVTLVDYFTGDYSYHGSDVLKSFQGRVPGLKAGTVLYDYEGDTETYEEYLKNNPKLIEADVVNMSLAPPESRKEEKRFHNIMKAAQKHKQIVFHAGGNYESAQEDARELRGKYKNLVFIFEGITKDNPQKGLAKYFKLKKEKKFKGPILLPPGPRTSELGFFGVFFKKKGVIEEGNVTHRHGSSYATPQAMASYVQYYNSIVGGLYKPGPYLKGLISEMAKKGNKFDVNKYHGEIKMRVLQDWLGEIYLHNDSTGLVYNRVDRKRKLNIVPLVKP